MYFPNFYPDKFYNGSQTEEKVEEYLAFSSDTLNASHPNRSFPLGYKFSIISPIKNQKQSSYPSIVPLHSGLPFRAKLLFLASIPLLPLFLEASQAFVPLSQL